VPLVGTLIVLPVKTEYTLKGAVAKPETPEVSEHEGVNEGGNMTFECSIGQLGV
jgi:hypothetical protein